MAILSDYLEPKLLDHIFKRGEFTRPISLYIGISSSAFTEADNGITAAAKEPGYDSTTPSYFGDGYYRVQINNNAKYDPTSTNIKNTIGIDFGEAGGSGWGSIQYWAIFDSNTSAANMLMHGSFTSAVTVSAGSQFRIGTGDLEIIFPTILNDANDVSDPALSTDINNYSRKWRAQLSYLIGFNHPTGVPSDTQFQFLFPTSSTSGFYDSQLFLGVSTTTFPESLGSAESSGTGYARVNITSAFADAATDGSGVTTISNSSAISFPEAGSDWGDIAYWAIFRGSATGTSANPHGGYFAQSFSSDSAGNHSSRQALMKGTLTASKTVNSGDVLRFGIGAFVVTAS
jgi:hypothetical protein